ncbi:CPBP family intramembrane glutamic endopeptidase [Halobium salinum]|uniref:CPBP family intramembrane glutamic endopeptidase n=1 Tax=Halobium salinum TaxID=1364940 RepID=A0ABD5PI13_9EURY|nr:type II CAAX endopeptidase family protein [Halobium salinum]
MADWTTFAGFTAVVLTLLLLLARLSQGQFRERPPSADDEPADSGPSPDRVRDGARAGTASGDRLVYPFADWPHSSVGGHASTGPARPSALTDLSPGTLLLNVAVSQGLFGGLLVAGAVLTGVPASAFGLDAEAFAPATLLAGAALGVTLYGANEVGAAVGERFGLGGGEALREALAPESALGWAVLLLVVLPVIAGFEELLFRGVLVGALSAGFGVSPWLLAALSSVAFALGHGAQGPTGVVVTGLLGFVLAAGYVLTGSLPAVILAHYLVNALEFVVHEGLEVDWA